MAATQHALEAARAAFGASAVNGEAARVGGAEDFAWALAHAPGNFAFIGNGDTAVCHSPHYDFNDDAIPHGVRYFTTLVRQRLAPG